MTNAKMQAEGFRFCYQIAGSFAGIGVSVHFSILEVHETALPLAFAINQKLLTTPFDPEGV